MFVPTNHLYFVQNSHVHSAVQIGKFCARVVNVGRTLGVTRSALTDG